MKEGKTEKIVGINHQTFRQKMASYKRHPGSLAVLIVTLLAAVITVGVLLMAAGAAFALSARMRA